MATPQLNLTISAGTSFSQSLNISNSDNSLTDLAGATMTARISKRAGSYNALTSTSATPVHDFVEMTTTIVNPAEGECSMSMTAAETAALEEGKYVYSVVLNDGAGNVTEILHGLVFVVPAIGFTTSIIGA